MFLADGFEETEALVTLDMLRRAEIDIKTVGVSGAEITGAHRITVKADITDKDFSFSDCEGIILPGGMPGTENLFSSDFVCDAVDFCYANNKLICAICAAPIILGRKGLLDKKTAVCFPGFEGELTGAAVIDKACIRDENIITAKGAGCVFEFSFEIISFIKGSDIAEFVIDTIQHKGKIY